MGLQGKQLHDEEALLSRDRCRKAGVASQGIQCKGCNEEQLRGTCYDSSACTLTKSKLEKAYQPPPSLPCLYGGDPQASSLTSHPTAMLGLPHLCLPGQHLHPWKWLGTSDVQAGRVQARIHIHLLHWAACPMGVTNV